MRYSNQIRRGAVVFIVAIALVLPMSPVLASESDSDTGESTAVVQAEGAGWFAQLVEAVAEVITGPGGPRDNGAQIDPNG